MTKRGLQVAGAILLVALAAGVAGALLDARDAGAAATPSKDVIVVNGAGQPVPVAGSVAISGTPTVAIAGTPTVSVADAAEPFKARLSDTLGDGDFSGGASLTVPAGKRLIVKAVSARTAAGPDQTMLVGINTADTGIVVPTEPQGRIAGSSGIFEHRAGAFATETSFGPGETVSMSVQRGSAVGPLGSAPPGIASATVHIAGYLVPA
jgi:hypothetical protein